MLIIVQQPCGEVKRRQGSLSATVHLLGLDIGLLPHGLGHLLHLQVLLLGLGQILHRILQLHLDPGQLVDTLRVERRGEGGKERGSMKQGGAVKEASPPELPCQQTSPSPLTATWPQP